MKARLSYHAKERLKEPRQKGIKYGDVCKVANSFIPSADIKDKIKVSGIAESGKPFKVVIVNEKNARLVVTVIGL